MSRKEQIQKDFVAAFKAKDEVKKAALSVLKAKITEAEKAKAGKEVGDDEVLKIIAASIKQRKQSVEAFSQGGRQELADREQEEIDVLQEYLPRQMSRAEIEKAVREIIQNLDGNHPQALVGKTMGAFGKQYVGMADMQVVKEVATEVANLIAENGD